MTETLIIGLCQLLISVVLFGTNLVPVKKCNSGDGFYAQWIMSIAILFVGFLIWGAQNFAYFYPTAMLGGVFWSLGNMLAIPIIKNLGLAVGVLIWSTTSTLVGWIIGTWGGFGIHARPASLMWLSYFGMALIFVGYDFYGKLEYRDRYCPRASTKLLVRDIVYLRLGWTNIIANICHLTFVIIGIMFMFIKSIPICEKDEVKYKIYEESDGHFKKVPIDTTTDIESVITKSNNFDDSDKNCKSNKIIGIPMALFAGILFGASLLPIIQIQDNEKVYPNAPKNGLPYVFSQCVGVFVTSSSGFFIYALIRRKNIEINPKVTIPALLSGFLWAFGEAFLINATSELSAAITYPISAKLPGCIAALWSIFYFKEIQTGKNLVFLTVAILITLFGAICIGVSK